MVSMASRGDTTVSINIQSGTIVKTILFLILFGLLWYLRDIVLIVLTAVVIASAMEPGIKAFNRWGLKRILAVILLYLIVLGSFLSILLFFLPPILNDAANFLTRLPDLLRSVNFTGSAAANILPISDIAALLSSADLVRTLSDTLGGTSGGIFTALTAFFGGILSFILVVVFSFYFSVQETGVDDFLNVVVPVRYQVQVFSLWKRSQEKIGKWMQGQLLLALLVGVLLFLGLTILQVPYALLLSVIAAAFELIPVFGQILAAIPAIAVAFSAGGVTLAVIVGGLFVVIQQFESHLIYPLVVKKIVGVPPLLVILALLVGAELAGFIGVLLSVPIAAALRELVADIEKDRAHELAREKMEA